jgi:anionic glutamate receptor
LTFVFGALLEFALVNYASRSDAHREKMKKQRKQWEMEHQAALDAMAADGLLDDRNSFAMVSGTTFFFKFQFPCMRTTDRDRA